MGEDSTVTTVTERLVDRVDDDHDKLIEVASDVKHISIAITAHVAGEEAMMKEWKATLDGMQKSIHRLTQIVYVLGVGILAFVALVTLDLPPSTVAKAILKLIAL
jgi:hypothetical protein